MPGVLRRLLHLPAAHGLTPPRRSRTPRPPCAPCPPRLAPGNSRQVDLVVAPISACQALTGATDGTCGGALSVVGTDGVTRFAVGTTAQLHMKAAETMTCSST